MTIQGGHGFAGGIDNQGKLTVENSVIINNICASCDGGSGIYNEKGGILIIQNTIFSHNYYSAIYNSGSTVTINNSTFDNNTGTNGAAIFNVQNGNVTINNSTLSNNTANSFGGAIDTIIAS